MSALYTFIMITHLLCWLKESIENFQGDDPCLSPYKKIDNFRRSVSYQLNKDDNNILCDSFIDEGWYRVTSITGERMPSECVQFGACGTQFGLWLKGDYPRENQTVVREVYVSGLLSCEDKFYTIMIRNCWNAFHLYWLVKTSACPEAYCFGREIPCPIGTSSETGLTPNCEEYPKENITLEVLSDLIYRNETNSKHHTITYVPEVVFMCVIGKNISDSLFYDVDWYINGDFVVKIKNQYMAESSIAPYLREEHWINKHRLNMLVTCAVRLKYKVDGAPSPQTFSNTFEAGIKIENNKYSVREAETISIPVWITIPFGCRWTSSITDDKIESNEGYPNDTCNLDFKVTLRKYESQHKTEDILLKNENCIIKWTSKRWTDNQYVTIRGAIDFIYNKAARFSNLSLLPYEFPHNAWKNAQTPNVMVTIEDSERELSSYMCKILTGLHIITFDGSVLKWKTAGEYILYKNEKFGVQVNIRVQKCRLYTRQVCICGLAVWNRDDYVLINFCSARYDDVESCEHNMFMIRRSCSNNLTSVSKFQDAYKIILLSGTEVIFERHEQNILYVQIKPSSYDRNSTDGLCGYFSGFKDDDLVLPDSNKIASSTDLFYKAWWVFGNRSLFNLTNLQNMKTNVDLHIHCRCNLDLSESCGYFVRGNILHSQEAKEAIVLGTCEKESHLISLDPSNFKTFDLINEDINVLSQIQDGPWRNGWNEALAKYTCESILLRRNDSLTCKENFPYIRQSQYFDICVQYIKSSGGKDLNYIVQSALFTECLFEALRSDGGVDNKNLSSGDVLQNATQDLLESKCRLSCKGHGECVLGTCICEQEYTGTVCSEKRTMSPLFTQCKKSLICDSKNSSCKRVLLSGTSFDEDFITCQIESEKIMTENMTTNLSLYDFYVTTGQAVSNNYGICNIQVPPSNEAIEYTISVSNRNHSVFNSGIKILVFNSDCFNCNSTLITCETKNLCKLKILPSDKREQKAGHKVPFEVIIPLVLMALILIAVPTTVTCFRRYCRDKPYESSSKSQPEAPSYSSLRGLEHSGHRTQFDAINQNSTVYDEIDDVIKKDSSSEEILFDNGYLTPINREGKEQPILHPTPTFENVLNTSSLDNSRSTQEVGDTEEEKPNIHDGLYLNPILRNTSSEIAGNTTS